MNDASEFRIVLTTVSPDGADPLARALVEERIAACVNALPDVRSTYRWEGEVTSDRETLLVIKCRAADLDRIERRIHDLHPYDVPEIVALPLAAGTQDYLRWLLDATERTNADG